MLRIIPVLAAAALTGCAATPQEVARADAADARVAAKLTDRLAGYTPGEPTSCARTINLQSDVYGDTIVYRDGRTLLVNRTNGGCFGLRRDDIIVTRSFGTQTCRGDLVRTVDRTNGFPSGACAFGDFVPYRKTRG